MGLSFLTPMLLAGAAFVAVPIVLHLMMRRKPVPHEFPALRFLQQRAVTNRRRLRLNHLFLLLLRMAALALFAMALARPVLRGATWLADREAPVAAAFVFDTAPRMLLREGNRTRLAEATARARLLFGKLPPGSSVAVLDTSGGGDAFAPSLAAAEARLERLAAVAPERSLPAAIKAGLRLLGESDLLRRELYVFTDCSQGAWAAGGSGLEELGPDTSVLFVDVSAGRPANFALGGLSLSSEQVAVGSPLGITVGLARTGPDTTRSVAVEIRKPDGSYARRAIKPVEWTAAATREVDFEVTGLEPGIRQGRVVVDGSDELEADNVVYFTVAVGPPPRVVVAAPAPESRTGLFMTQAIAPAALTRAGLARFQVRLVGVESLGPATFTDAEWDEARGLVLIDPPPLPLRTWEALEAWVAAGRGLVVWLGPRAAPAERFNSAAAIRLLGGSLLRVWRNPGGVNYLAPTALDHPALAAFRRVGDDVPWEDFPVLRHWELAVADPDEAAAAAADAPGGLTVVAAYRNGLPAVLEHRVGRGTVVVVTTPVSQEAADPEAWNSLATGFEPWPFVMLANEILLHAIDTAADFNIESGGTAVIQVGRRDLQTAFVQAPGGDDFPAVIDQRRSSVAITTTREPGNYSIRAGGDVGGVATGFSVNLPPAAVDFTRLSDEDLAAVVGPRARLARSEEDLVRDVNLERIGSELSGWIILLAALAMAADWVVANRFYAPRDVEQTPAAEAFARELESPSGRSVVPPPVPPRPVAVPPPPPPPPATSPPPLPEIGA
jgi:hypothetical protein